MLVLIVWYGAMHSFFVAYATRRVVHRANFVTTKLCLMAGLISITDYRWGQFIL